MNRRRAVGPLCRQPSRGLKLIVFIVTAEHKYTLEEVAQESTGAKVLIASYDEIMGNTEFPIATYIFTDLDRLPIWRLELVAELYLQLRTAGLRVLNDPVLVLSRYGLLRKLYRLGINDFDAYRVEEEVMPERWPVFLRSEGNHREPLSGLLNNREEVQGAISAAIARGAPVTAMLLVEFAAEPVLPGLYRKLSIFRIGDSYFAANCVHEDNWLVKYGKQGIAPPELYEDELRIVRENPFEAALKPAFEAAGLEYGRADFGIVGGKVQIYEINGNPKVSFPTEHPSDLRIESYKVFKSNFFAALDKVDTPNAPVGGEEEA